MDGLNTVQSARHAFETNGIPAVRVLEKQLRASVLRDKERLRALVGGNYRELLSTAEEIVALGTDTKNAEHQISTLSQQCKPPQNQVLTRQISTVTLSLAQLRLTIQCLTCASRALQNRSLLLCAKLTVISRLLLKSLSEQQPSPISIESLRENAAAIRRRLLRLIDAQLTHPGSSTDTLVNAVCSYCLITSASSGDAMKHFRAVRLERLRQRVNSDGKNQLLAEEAFRYLITTVQSLKSLLGRPVNDALGLLQKQPILQDPSIRSLEALDVDQLHNLIQQDILSFTPYVKRVLLKQDEVQQILRDWVGEACQAYAKGLQSVLATMSSIEAIFTLRRNLFSMIMPVYFSTNAPERTLETIRHTTSERVLELCKAQVETLATVADNITSSNSKAAAEASLWDTSLTHRSGVSKGTQYVQQVRDSHLGTRGGLVRSLKKIRIWARQVAQLRDQFQSLESTRWRDLLEEPDEEDEESANAIVIQLSRDDPTHFRTTMEAAVQSAVSRFNQTLHDAATEIIEPGQSNGKAEEAIRIVYLLRALRESSKLMSASAHNIQVGNESLTTKLHGSLATCVSQQITSSLNTMPVSSRSDSSLPDDLPSPQAFKLLRDTCRAMAEIGGTDIWSAAAVASLKTKLRADILETETHPAYLQTDFDKAFIRAALSVQSDAKTQTDVDSNAQAYWQRTRLLFGVLN